MNDQDKIYQITFSLSFLKCYQRSNSHGCQALVGLECSMRDSPGLFHESDAFHHHFAWFCNASRIYRNL